VADAPSANALVGAVLGFDRDIERQMMAQAGRESADYATAHMLTALPVRGRKYPDGGRLDLLEHALSLVTVDGFYAEFGVYKGESLAFICDHIDKTAYGFDSFEGLPEDWFLQYGRGYSSLEGKAPHIYCEQHNHRVLKGLFAETLPIFTEQVEGPAAFLHLDCDLYSSTRTALEGLVDRIVPGTVILLGTYLNYPGWRAHQFRAFQEFVTARGVRYRYAAFAPAMFSVAAVVESV
jgi:hypothetical protein